MNEFPEPRDEIMETNIILPSGNKAPEYQECNSFSEEKETEEATEKITLIDGLPQIFVCCLAHCIVIQAGINMVYNTILIENFNRTGEMAIGKTEESWITSLVAIGVPIGALMTGPLMDKFGRKTICLASCIPALLSWIILITANSINLVYISRCIAGFSSGLSTVGLIYVSEITHPRIRPMMLCCNSVFVSLGILITCCLAVYLNWKQIAIVFLIMECLIIIGLLFIPESPYWYLCFGNGMKKEKRVAKAEKSLQWLNRKYKIYKSEYTRIKEICKERKNIQDETLIEKLKYLGEQVSLPTAYKPLAIIFILLILQQMTGCYVMIFYATKIFKSIGENFQNTESSNSIYRALLLLGIVRFSMSILTAYFSKIFGRRTLCISSGIGMAISMFLSGIYMYKKGNDQTMIGGYNWIFIVLIQFFVFSSSIGIMVIPWTLSGELLPISVRGIGSGIMVAIAYTAMFGVLKVYPYLVEAIDWHGIFFFFCFMSLVVTSFVYFFLPETLGKSFSEIEKYFVSKREKERAGVEVNVVNE